MTRKIRNIWEPICNYESLYVAWREVRSGKGNKPQILKYESNLPINLLSLESRLLSGEYCPKPHYEFHLFDGKPRLIQAPHLEDRIVQHSVCNVLRFPLQKRLIHHTYSCLVGRGTHKCSEQFEKYIKNPRWKYALKMDVSKFFYSIDHETLISELEKHIGCKKTLKILKFFIKSNSSATGIPIGASTSQILANMALNPLDHYARRDLGINTYMRYCDDMIALFPAHSEAEEAFNKLKNKLNNDLKMQLNPKSGIHYVDNGVDWIGYRHYRFYKIIRKKTLKRINSKANHAKLQTTMAYLSHVKNSASLNYVISIFLEKSPEHKQEILEWMVRNLPKNLSKFI